MGVLVQPLPQLPSVIPGAVTDHIDSSWTLVTTAFETGLQTIDALGNQEFLIDWSPVDVEILDIPSVDIGNEPDAPTVNQVPLSAAQFGGLSPTLSTISIDNINLPSFVEKDYQFNIPGAPVVNWPEFSKSPPGVSDISIPSAPSFNIPEVPALTQVTVPAPPEYSLPEFDGTLPVDDLAVPALSFSWGESQYSSSLKTKLGDWLYDQLVSGGTGLDENTEQAIYDRAKSRQEEENQAVFNSINDGMASRGFPLPPGIYVNAVLEAENKILRARGDLNNDILINQSKLAQENTHFAVQESTKLESVLIDYHKSTQDRALDAAKFVVNTAAQLYSLRVEAYKAKLQSYAIVAQVYQTRIQGEIAKAEFYRAQIEGVKASVGVQQAMIDAYRAQVAGIAALVDVYKAQMEGAALQAGIDKTRMEGFLAEVQTYVARVNGEAAKFEGYKAQIAGESAKADMYRADAEAYIARISGEKLKVDAQVAKAAANLENTKAQIEVFNGYVQKYSVDVQFALTQAEILAKEEGLKVEVFKAEADKYSSKVDAYVRAYLGKVEEIKNRVAISLRESEVAVQTLFNKYQLTSENLRAAAQIAGQMAAGAAASINTSLNAGYSESYGNQNQTVLSGSYSESESNSTVTEDIHTYSA